MRVSSTEGAWVAVSVLEWESVWEPVMVQEKARGLATGLEQAVALLTVRETVEGKAQK